MKDKNTDQIDDIREDPFEEYIRMGEPDKADKAYAWQTAVGLQDVDKLRPSEYLLNTAKENIDGNISIDEVRKRIQDNKQHIEQHIESEDSLLEILGQKEISSKMKDNVMKLYKAFGREKVFGRSDVVEILGITERPASTLLGKMYTLELTEKIIGAGKGKYRFIV